MIHLATGNPDKVRELAALLDLGDRLRPPPSGHRAPEETEATYRDNALLKARALAAAVGGPAIADDSGLEVDALDGRPGVHSARYAETNDARIARLLDELHDVPEDARTARFRCALALVLPSGEEHVVEGTCEGRIAPGPRGAGGFGYDPIFVPAGDGRTFAEISAAEKDVVSHRGKAARALRDLLKSSKI